MIIYNVMNVEEWVGTFYCGSFSTKEKAQEYVDKQPTGYSLYIEEYLIDSSEESL